MTRAHDQVIETAEHIEEAAAAWVTRIDLRGTPDEWTRLDAWLAASPRHRAAFLRLSVAWRRLDQLKGLALTGSEVDADLLDPARWSAASEDIAAALPEAPPPQPPLRGDVEVTARHSEPHQVHLDGLRMLGARSREHSRSYRLSARGSRLAASLVAALVLAAGGYGGWLALNRGHTESYSTAVGEFRRIPLQDGSTLALNTDTKVSVTFSRGHRKVELAQGEALFSVAHDTSRPFDVQAGSTVVRAVGTQFAVRRLEDSSVDVYVSEGRVSINPPSSPTFAAGTVAYVRNGHVDARAVSRNDITDSIAWTAQRLVFKGETLAKVVEEFNRYNLRKLVVPAPALAQQHIGGSFPANDPDGFAISLERFLGVHARHDMRDGVEVILLEQEATLAK